MCLQTNAWVANKRPELMDHMGAYWMGGSALPDDMM